MTQDGAARQTPSILGLRLLKSGAIYTGSLIMQRAVTFLILPLYLPALGAAQYGELALLISLIGVFVTVGAFGLETIILKRFLDLAAEPAQQHALVSTVNLFLIVAASMISVVGVVLALVLTDTRTATMVALAMGAATMQILVTTVPYAIWRAQESATIYARTNIQYSIVMALILVVTVVVLNWGIWGWLIANALAWLSTMPYAVGVSRSFWTPRLRPDLLGAALLLAVPLVPHSLAQWSLSVSDRAILSASVSLEEVGLYNLGYQTAGIAALCLTALNWTVMPHFTRATSNSRSLEHIVSIQILGTGLICLVGALLGPPILQTVLPADFDGATSIIPWVMLGYLFFGLYYIPMDFLVLREGRTRWIWVCTVLAAIGNISLNLIFIPVYGVEAAAVNTAVGYGILFATVTTLAAFQTAMLKEVPWRLLVIVAAILGLSYSLASFTRPDELWPAGLLRVGCIGVAAIAALVMTPAGRVVLRTVTNRTL